MAYNQIPVDPSKFWGQKLLRCRGLLIETREVLREVQGKMTACIDGSDYAQLESQFGIPTGKGQTAYNELNSLMGKLDSNAQTQDVAAAIAQLINYIG